MSSPKIKRLEATVLRALSEIIRLEVKHPDITFITLTAAKLSTDLSHLKIYYTTFNHDEETVHKVALALEKSKAFIRTKLVHMVKMRKSPALIFTYDDSLTKGNEIEQGLKNVLEDK